MADISINYKKDSVKAEAKLRKIAETCRGTKGRWEQMDNIKWNDITHTPRHANLLSNVLVRAYVKAKRGN